MADKVPVKAIFTGADVTSLGEFAAADTIPGSRTSFSATDKLLGRATAGAGAGEEIACTAAGRSILDDANVGAIRTTLGVGTADTVTLGGLVVPGYTNRNAIINGAMDIWQRGTATLVNPASTTYFPDRFRVNYSLGDGTFNLLQSAETPAAGFPFQYSLKLDCTHVETAVTAGEFSSPGYAMEGFDFKRFEGETATLSFWVKAVKTGIYCVSFRNGAANKSYIHEFTINSASTWEKKTVTLTFNSGGTFLYTTGIGLYIYWTIMCGSTYQIATANKDTWQDGNYLTTDAQVNGLDSTDNNFWLTGVQMELGSVATPFESRSIQQELAMCQRYYEKSYDPAVAPGTTTTAGILTVIALSTTALTGQRYQVVKRAVPTVVFYSRNGTAGKVSTTAAGTDTGTACVVNTPGEAGFGGVYEASPYTGGVGYEYFFTASCEL